MGDPDAVVVGAGPNGLSAALTLACAGMRCDVYERSPSPGGGCRTAELTLPGYLHDVCSAAHPLAVASPFFADFDLLAHGVRMIQPATAFAHPLDGGRAITVSRSVRDTAAGLGPDADWYRRLVGPMVDEWRPLMAAVLAPLQRAPRHPVALARFGLRAIAPTSWLVRRCVTEEARALLAGASAHAGMPLDRPVTGGFGVLMTALAHAVGWPIVRGGSQRLTDALVGALEASGSAVRTGVEITSLAELPRAPVTLLDVTPRQLLDLDDGRLPYAYRRSLATYRYGPGTCKVDFAVGGPGPLVGRGLPRGRNPAPRGRLRGDRLQRSRGGRGETPGSTVRSRDAALGFRPHPRPRGTPHALGLLPRAGREPCGHVRPDRGADRALCPRLL